MEPSKHTSSTTKPRLFESFWVRNGRAHVFIGILTIIIAVALGGLTALPLDWWQRSLNDAGIIQLIQHAALLLMAIIGIILGIRIIVMPRTPSRPYGNVQHERITQVSVYLDLENQMIPIEYISNFIIVLRKFVQRRRFAFFLYADTTSVNYLASTRIYWKYGFIPVDVPHKLYIPHVNGLAGITTTTLTIKNFADMELSLHAYERGLSGKTLQDILLITADHDFIPLIRRLISLGHRVTLWALELSPMFKVILTDLGVPYREFGDWSLLKHSTQPGKQAQETANSPLAMIKLTSFIQNILNDIQHISAMTDIQNDKLYNRFMTTIGMYISSFLPRHFIFPLKSIRILAVLNALDVIQFSSAQKGKLPIPGSRSAADGATLLYAFLVELIEATQSEQLDKNATIPAIIVVKKLVKQQDDLMPLRQKMIDSPIFAILLLQLAQSLGMVSLLWRQISPGQIAILNVHFDMRKDSQLSAIPDTVQVDATTT